MSSPSELLPEAIASRDLRRVASLVADMDVWAVTGEIERLPGQERALVFRVLPKDRALEVFEALDPTLSSDLVNSLQKDEVAEYVEHLDPNDRVALIDELPAKVANRLLRGLSVNERQLTASVAGYPKGSIGRRMSPEVVTLTPTLTVAQATQRLRSRDDAETLYMVPVVDGTRRLVGIASLRAIFCAEPEDTIESLMTDPQSAQATDEAEHAARRCADQDMLALPVVDGENRVVGVLTVEDAYDILEDAESEDQARSAASEPLRRPYLATPVRQIVRSRVVWLLILAFGATLTVHVLDTFEATLAQVVTLALFVPLVIGTGGNTGNQAATTVTRALALGDVRPSDVWRIALREMAVGALLGLILGSLGFLAASLVFTMDIGLVLGLTLLCVCTVSATVGGIMPVAARAIHADPAVFSNPFITTFVDAVGLVAYFLIATWVLGLA